VNADLGIGETGFRARGFDYRVDLPDHVDLENVDAVMDHGLLTVTLPRATPLTGRAPGMAARPAGRPLGVTDPAADRELHHPDVAAADLTALRRRE
jgi:HSP20 family protein